MYKIHIRHKNRNLKTKYYETREEFIKWLKSHTKHYKCYVVLGFKLVALNPNVWGRDLGE